MTNILLEIIICGIATAAICNTVTRYDGPFQIFPRFRRWLLTDPGIKPEIHEIGDIDDLKAQFNTIIMSAQSLEGLLGMWETYQTIYNPKFSCSLRGTLYGMLDCPFCLGPYISFAMGFLVTGYMMLIEPIGWHNLVSGIIVTLGAYGLHFLITNWWEDRANAQGV
jgi:hypothetical protein